MTDAVPTLDARSAGSERFARDISAAYAEYGFVIIENHGIDRRLIDQCLGCFRAFFALPVEAKKRYQLPAGGGARGYTPFGIETAKGATHHDLKEFWHVGRELPAGHPFTQFMAPNIWPEAIPGFRESTLSLYESFDALGRRLLAPIAQTIGLPTNYFDDKVDLGNSILRIIHYPPMPPEPTPSVRAGARDQPAARPRLERALLAALLPAFQPGLRHPDTAAMRGCAAPRPVPRSHQLA
jgi:isopenicillin N synthase-like dioxygenase